MIKLFTIIAFNIILFSSLAQEYSEPWDLLKTTDSITLYVRKIPNTEIRELKLITTFKTSAVNLVSAIKDVEEMPEWSHTCRSTKLVKQISNMELFFHYVADIPWPIRGKDVVLHLEFFQDSVSGLHTITSNNYDGLLPPIEDITRVDYMKAKWIVMPISEELSKVEYFISLKINDTFPDWLINTAISYSPVHSMNALKEIVEN